jgi:hypothetical protein
MKFAKEKNETYVVNPHKIGIARLAIFGVGGDNEFVSGGNGPLSR